MSDYYFSYTSKTRHAELVEQARQDHLARQLPSHPGPFSRLLGRLSRPTEPTATSTTSARLQPRTPSHA